MEPNIDPDLANYLLGEKKQRPLVAIKILQKIFFVVWIIYIFNLTDENPQKEQKRSILSREQYTDCANRSLW